MYESEVRNNNSLIPSLNEALKINNLVLVTFTTKAGTQRVMGCTRNLSAIPEDAHEGINDPKLNHESIICVYDFQNSSWRSFRKDAVTSFVIHE